MTRRVLWVAIAVALTAVPTLAHAETSLITPLPGYVYFNRAGATPETHDADLRACVDAAGRLVQPNPGAGAGAGGGLIGMFAAEITRGIMHSMKTRRGVVANTENCMVVRGWRIVRIEEALGEELAALDQPALAERLALWIGSDNPPGEIVRQFANDIALVDTIPYGPAGDLDKVPLSVSALATAEDNAEPAVADTPRPARVPVSRRPRTANPSRALSAEQLAGLAPDATLVVVRLVGTDGVSGTSLSFARTGEGGGNNPGFVDGQPDYFTAGLPQRALIVRPNEPFERTLIFQVPPGRWRINSIGHTLWHTSLCMGAPVFEIGQGEVVFMQFDLTRGRAVDVSNTAAQAALVGAPHSVSSRVRGASFVNGATWRCQGSAALYAWEIPNAPFLPDYALGSRANVLPVIETQAAAEIEAAPAAP